MVQTNTQVVVPVSAERAFEMFAGSFGEWWPSDYTWSQQDLVDIGIESGSGGMCYEIGPHGFRCDFGRVFHWTPGEKLAFTWQISPEREPVPNPGEASEVVVEFRGNGDETTVKLSHQHFERHDGDGEKYCEMMGSEYGWPRILECFSDYVEAEMT